MNLAKQGFWPWVLQRLTGLILVVGLAVHFWVLHFAIERPVTFDKVLERLRYPGWVLFDLLLLVAAIYHGLNGLWAIILDYAPNDLSKRVVGLVLWIVGIVTLLIGVHVLAGFA